MLKKVISTALFLVLVAILSGNVIALDATITKVKVDGNDVQATGTNFIRNVERGEEIDVTVEVQGTGNVENAQIEAAIRGIDSAEEVEDITDVFDIKAGVSYVKRFKLTVPDKADQDQFRLRIRVDDKDGSTTQQDYFLDIAAARHEIVIRDIIISPDDEVRAGRGLLVTVRLKNLGQKDEDDIRVKVNIPELGISATDFIEDIESDKSKSTEEMFLRIPDDAEPGVYTVRTDVFFHNGEDEDSKSIKVRVAEREEKQQQKDAGVQTVVEVSGDGQRVSRGQSAVFPISITNKGKTARSYSVMVEGTSGFGTYQVSPSNMLIIDAGQTKTVSAIITPDKKAQNGEKIFKIVIRSGNEVLKEVPVKVVVDGKQVSGRKIFEWLIVILVLLVIAAAIFYAVKMYREGEGKKPEPGEKTAEITTTETYY